MYIVLETENKGTLVSQLKLGMYVRAVDIPWKNTDSPFQGLMIQSVHDIEKISSYCHRVYVDEKRSRPELQLNGNHLSHRRGASRRTFSEKQSASKALKKVKPARARDWKLEYCLESYELGSSFKNEMFQAKKTFAAVEGQLSYLCENILQSSRGRVTDFLRNTEDIVDSIVRNPDAFSWLCRVRDTPNPVYLHSIRLAVLACVVGRQLGLHRSSLVHLCSALFMTGIGKSHISEQALASYRTGKPGHDFKKHLHETVYHLSQLHFDVEDVVSILKNYSERVDGSGFPAKKKAPDIPFLAQLCGLVETFELLINPFDSSKALSPANAIAYLKSCKGQQFEASLVGAVIKALGIYPTGTLVELNTGQKGAIVSQNHEDSSRVNVIPILNARGNAVSRFAVLDLAFSRQHAEHQERVYIRRGIPSTNIPRGLLEEAHRWMFSRRSSLWGGVKHLFAG